MEALDTPILFLVFNRPDPTRLVFEKIREIQPRQLFVAADGPRAGKEGEKEKCDMVRSIATAVDWDCELKILFRKENLGCGKAVSEAITWFFENVEAGIILEDDCVPDHSFFLFCRTLLNRYKNESRIMHIGGTNLQFNKYRGDGDYYFSIISHVWGWATWRRAWNNYEFNLNNIDDISESTYNYAFNNNQLFINYYKYIFNEIRNARIDTWDYQWFYSILLNRGLSICPNINLVNNIGFGIDATHTLQETEWNKLNFPGTISSYNEPSILRIDYSADKFTLEEIIGIKETVKANRRFNFYESMKYILTYILNKFK